MQLLNYKMHNDELIATVLSDKSNYLNIRLMLRRQNMKY